MVRVRGTGYQVAMALRKDAELEYARLFASRPAIGKLMIFGRPTMLWDNAPTPEDFFRKFGFEEVHTLDVSSYQGASHIHDLNDPLPAEWAGQYDVAIVGGTLEHVFDIANAMQVLASLVKVGGWVLCGGPGNNWIDHGYYQFSPMLSIDYFRANGFELGASMGHLTSQDQRRAFPLYPGEGHKWNGSLMRFSHTLLARKLETSTIDKVPTQGLYVDAPGGERRRQIRFEASEPNERRGGTIRIIDGPRVPLADFRPLDGRWAAPFRSKVHHASLEKRPFRSSALVYEDGELLKYIVSDPAMVKDRPGTFHHGPGFMHFSTPDGSDPRRNGRRYEAVFPDLSGWLRS